MQIVLKEEHITMFEGQEQCQIVEIQNLNLISSFLSFSGEYSYRGHSDENWRLQTTFERFLEKNPTTVNKEHIEEKIISLFKQKSHIYLQKESININNLEPLDVQALIQHHGGPTRLLDFTESFMTAIAFASLDNSTNSCAVIGLRRLITEVNSDVNDFLRDILLDYEKKGKLGPNVQIPPPTDNNIKLTTYFPKAPCLRNIFQNGYFIIPKTIDLPFEKVLANNLNLDEIKYNNKTILNGNDLNADIGKLNEILKKSTLLKVVFPSDLKKELRRYVFKNTSMQSLFPDISGITKSLYEIDTTII